MKILITGGHFSPAYSLIKELKKRGHEVSIAGRRYPFEGDKSESFEYQIARKDNLPFYEVKTGRFQRKLSTYAVTSLLKTPMGILTSFKILRKAKPDVVLTFGGYIGLPISLAARLLGIRIVLHEQTQKAGLASKIIGKFANRICISFTSSKAFFPPNKTSLTGNPIRNEIFESKKNITLPLRRLIYVTGGSTGSHFINSVIYEIAADLLSDFAIIHQTGESLKHRDYEKLEHLRNGLPKDIQHRYVLKKFIYPDEIGDVFKKADLIISRSGANIMYEIMATQKMSLLIPLPHGQNEEQISNATFLKELGISEFIEEKDVDSEKILNLIRQMFQNKQKYENNMNKAKEFVILAAAEKIADIVEEIHV